MDWAYDAAQAGYKFMPHQVSYQAQLGTIAQFVGMEHMHPSVVDFHFLGFVPMIQFPSPPLIL
jgi:hypothetical protein